MVDGFATKRVALSRTLASGLGLGAGDRNLARADHLDQAVRADHPLEGLDLVGAAGDLDGQRAPGDVDDLAAKDLGAENLFALEVK